MKHLERWLRPRIAALAAAAMSFTPALAQRAPEPFGTEFRPCDEHAKFEQLDRSETDLQESNVNARLHSIFRSMLQNQDNVRREERTGYKLVGGTVNNVESLVCRGENGKRLKLVIVPENAEVNYEIAGSTAVELGHLVLGHHTNTRLDSHTAMTEAARFAGQALAPLAISKKDALAWTSRYGAANQMHPGQTALSMAFTNTFEPASNGFGIEAAVTLRIDRKPGNFSAESNDHYRPNLAINIDEAERICKDDRKCVTVECYLDENSCGFFDHKPTLKRTSRRIKVSVVPSRAQD